MQVVFAEARCFGDARDDIFSEVHAFELRVQRDLETVGLLPPWAE